MAGDIDEKDLYPPDARELTPEAKSQRVRAAVGTALVVWGTTLLIERVLHVNLESGMLGLGIGALVGWSQLRTYPWFVAGAVLTGIGLGDFVGQGVHGPVGASLSSLLIALSFVAVFVRYPSRSRWALVPAAVMGVVGAGALGVGLIGLVPSMVGNFLLPLLLIVGGGLLVFRRSVPRKALRCGLAVVLGTFVLVGMSNIGEINNPGFDWGRQEVGVALPTSLEGKTLVIEAGNGDVTIHEGPAPARVVALVKHRGHAGSSPAATTSVDKVTVDLGHLDGYKSADYEAWVPAGTNVQVTANNGNIDAFLSGGDVRLTSDNGDIGLQVMPSTVDGLFKVVTHDGHVSATSSEGLSIDVASDNGDIAVNGRDYAKTFTKSLEGASRLSVVTDSGDVDIKAAR